MTEFFIKNILTEELFGNRLCESLEDQQMVDFFYRELLLEKFLYGEPITVPELRKLLRQKIINFEFIKLDGEVRPAEGTTMMKYIPKKDHPKGIRPSSPKVATFFDLDKMAWRSVSQRSKEIVLKKDEEKGRPIVVVRDKDKEATKVPKGEKPTKPVEVTRVKPGYEEPIDELKVGDVRNYLNRYGKNIQVEIIRIGDDGSVYARTTADNALFKVPEARLKNIGEIVPKEEVQRGRRKILTTQPVGPTPPPKPKEEPTTILLPKEEIESKEPPEQIQTEEPGAEEL
jgi:hypothetical protein